MKKSKWIVFFVGVVILGILIANTRNKEPKPVDGIMITDCTFTDEPHIVIGKMPIGLTVFLDPNYVIMEVTILGDIAMEESQLAQLNAAIEHAETKADNEKKELCQKRLDYLRSQTITVGELLDREEAEHVQDNRFRSSSSYGRPNYHILRYVEQIILERQKENLIEKPQN